MQAPKAQGRGRRVVANLAALTFLAATLLGLWVLVRNLVLEWRSGAAFTRYRNWEGLMVSHADMLIFMAIAGIAMIVGAVWSLWDRGKDRRLARKIAKDRGAG
jgi:hypothetical protein